MRIGFFGTPSFAVRILEQLLSWPEGEVAVAVTQPDRPASRGRRMQASAVKKRAEQYGLPLAQPEKLDPATARDLLDQYAPDILVVAAYGLILPADLLSSPPYGAVNVHASLLPLYRGAAPIQRALLHGERVTGVTIMQMEPGLDSGPILQQRALAIGIHDTAATLHDQLADMGGELLIDTLKKIPSQELVPLPQDEDRACYAPKLTKAEGEIDWNHTAWRVHNRIQAVHPWPGAFFYWTRPDTGKQVRLRLFPGSIGPEKEESIKPGTLLADEEGGLCIACQDRLYEVHTIQPESAKPMGSEAFVRGYLKQDAG